MERRTIKSTSLRAAEYKSTGVMRLSGYAAVFNSTTKIANEFHERLCPGCFTDALKTSDARFFWNHQTDGIPLGRQSAGSLRLAEDSQGLKFELDVPNTEQGRGLFYAVQRGDVDSMSFSFGITDGDEWDNGYTCEDMNCCTAGSRKQLPLRRIKRVAFLGETSAVNYPAYAAANVKTVEDLSAKGQPDDQDTGTLEGEDVTEYSSAGVVVPAEVRSRARAIRSSRGFTHLSPEEWRRRAEARLAAVTEQVVAQEAIRAAVEQLELVSNAALDLAYAEDVKRTKQVAGWIRHPHTYPGSCEEFLRFLADYQK